MKYDWMRFRAKEADKSGGKKGKDSWTGRWIYWDIFGCWKEEDGVGHIDINDIDTDTIGIFTGKKDSKDNELYTDDIFISYWLHDDNRDRHRIRFGPHSTDGEDYYTCGADGFYTESISGEEYALGNYPSGKKGIELFGNIYDNPDWKSE